MDRSDDPACAVDAPAGQFALLAERRFAPFFWTQFLGAGNDNLFKFALTVLVTYQLEVAWLPPSQAGLAIGALFILPFLLFSATSGQLADKVDKARLMRLVKTLEVAIMAVAAWAFLEASVPVLLACVFLMGLHSTLFGPVKFAYLPQHLTARELTGGNGMVEMGTFVAILLGNVVGGVLIAVPEIGAELVATACVGLALLGRATAQTIPASPSADPQLVVNWNPVSETWRNLRIAHADPIVFRTLLGISWMWFFGAMFLAQFPAFAKEVLHGDERVASLLLVVFSLGIGGGSLLCEVLSRRQVDIGLVPLGAIGMSVFSIDLAVAAGGLPAATGTMTVAAFLALPAHWRVMADLALLAASAGLYSVPMYALIQLRTGAGHRARIIAANNILNALFMIASSVLAGLLLQRGLTMPQVFLVAGIANAVVAGGLFLLVPDYLLRFAAFWLSRFAYRFRVDGEEHIPAEGAAILFCRVRGPADALLLTAATPRPIRFLMEGPDGPMPFAGRLLAFAGSMQVEPAVDGGDGVPGEAREVLRAGGLLAVLPAAGRRPAGSGGLEAVLMRLLESDPVPVVTLRLQGPADGMGCPATGGAAAGGAADPPPMSSRRRRSGMTLTAAAPLLPSQVAPQSLDERIGALLAG